VDGFGAAWAWGGVESGEAQREQLNSAPIGEEAKMANANEAFGKQMQQEAAQKTHRVMASSVFAHCCEPNPANGR
jgi:hypothetical protein